MDISLQLYSIKEESKENFEHALELTEKAGFNGVEFAGYFDNSAEEMSALLKKYHLKPVSTHCGLDRLKTALDVELEYAKALGYKLIVCPGIGCDSKEQIIRDAGILEACAKKAANDNIVIGYHNHAHEYAKFDGVFALDILFENAPTVQFEPDLFWIAVAGVDPVEYVKPFAKAGRVCAVHAKELAKEGRENVYIGEGKIDFRAIAGICSPLTIPYIIEQEEYSGDHFDGISKSYNGLRKIFDAL